MFHCYIMILNYFSSFTSYNAENVARDSIIIINFSMAECIALLYYCLIIGIYIVINCTDILSNRILV